MRHERADTVPFGSGFARGAATEGAVPSRSSILVRVHGRLPSIQRRQGADVLAHVFQKSAAVVRSGVRACVLQNGQALVRPRKRVRTVNGVSSPAAEPQPQSWRIEVSLDKPSTGSLSVFGVRLNNPTSCGRMTGRNSHLSQFKRALTVNRPCCCVRPPCCGGCGCSRVSDR